MSFIHAYNTFWWHLPPPIPPLRFNILTPLLISCPLLFFSLNSISCPYTHGCRATYWSMGNLPGITSLKKTDSPASKRHQLSLVPIREGSSCPPCPMLGCWLAWSSADNHSCYECSGPAMSRKLFCLRLSQPPVLTIFPSLPMRMVAKPWKWAA